MVRSVRAVLPASLPVVQTVFSPVSIAAQLAGADRLRDHLEDEPAQVIAALRRLTERTVAAIRHLYASPVPTESSSSAT